MTSNDPLWQLNHAHHWWKWYVKFRSNDSELIEHQLQRVNAEKAKLVLQGIHIPPEYNTD